MDQALAISSSLNNFTETEFNLFCDQLFDKFGKKPIMIQSLFNLLLNDSKQNNYKKSQEISKIIRNISNLQKKNKNSTKISTFDAIPSDMIAKTATFLDNRSFLDFSQTNKHIAISLNKSPLLITNLLSKCWFHRFITNHGHNLIKYQLKFNIKKLRMIKKIAINWLDFKIMYSTLGIQEIWQWNDLDLLSIHSFKIRNDYIKTFYPHFLKLLSLINVKQLSLNDCCILDVKKFPYFMKLICCNERIKCLSLPQLIIEQTTTGYDYSFFKDLKGLKGLILKFEVQIRPSPFYENIMHYLYYSLQSLHISCKLIFETIYNPYIQLLHDGLYSNNEKFLGLKNDAKYVKLEELCVNDFGSKEIVFLTKFTRNLKRIHWNILVNSNLNIVKNVYINLLNYCKKLEYVFIGAHICIIKLLIMIKEILNNIKERKSYFRLKIESKIEMDDYNVQYFNLNLLKLLYNLKNFVTKHWNLEIIIHIKKNDLLYIKKKMSNNDLQSKYVINMVQHNDTKYKIAISNKKNKMNGYNVKWIFSCNHCDFL